MSTFSHCHKVMTFFSCRLVTTPQTPIFLTSCCPVFFVNSATKILFFHSGFTPGWCHPGRSALSPPSPVTPLAPSVRLCICTCVHAKMHPCHQMAIKCIPEVWSRDLAHTSPNFHMKGPEGESKMRNLASFSTSRKFEPPAFENAARYPNYETNSQRRLRSDDRSMSSPSSVKLGPRTPDNHLSKVSHPQNWTAKTC